MIKINQEKCIGCSTCESLCPKVFKLNNETYKAEVISQEIGDCDIQNAIESCAADAILQE